jgi:hypothetical protein
MGRLARVCGYGALGVVGLVGLGIGGFAVAFPRMRPAPAENVEITPERVARGRYLAEHVMGCTHCHSQCLEDRLGAPVETETLGAGGFAYNESHGMPGIVCAPNITPDQGTGIGAWTDGEIMRAIREGVDRNGRTLFPMMPYAEYRDMGDEDVRAIVAYLRTLSPVKNAPAETKIQFPVNQFVKLAPAPLKEPVATPDDTRDHLGYGRYLTHVAGCQTCHTPHDDHGHLLADRQFSGGWVMKGPAGTIVTPNITPVRGAYLATASRENFIGRFKAYSGLDAKSSPHVPKGQASPMPWAAFAGMSDRDLSAIYDYLKTVAPIESRVDAHSVANSQTLSPSRTTR